MAEEEQEEETHKQLLQRADDACERASRVIKKLNTIAKPN